MEACSVSWLPAGAFIVNEQGMVEGCLKTEEGFETAFL